MDKDDLFWTWFTGLFLAATVAVLVVVASQYHFRIMAMADKGYCETTIPGSASLAWQKCK